MKKENTKIVLLCIQSCVLNYKRLFHPVLYSAVIVIVGASSIMKVAAGTHDKSLADREKPMLLSSRMVVPLPSVAVSLPQQVNFDGFTGSNLNTVFPNWQEATGASSPSGTTSNWTDQTGLGTSGNTTARINLYSDFNEQWIVGPVINPSASDELSYKVAVTNWNSITSGDVMGADDMLRVMISTDNGSSWSAVDTVDASDNLTITLTERKVDLSPYAGQDIIIAFLATDGPIDNSEDYDLHLDDIFIGQATTTSSLVTQDICYADIPPAFNNLDSISGGTGPFTYLWQTSTDTVSWSAAAGDNDSISYVPTMALFDTTYFRRVVIDQSCGDSAFSNIIKVQVPDSLSLDTTISNVSCNSLSNGSIDMTVSGGASPYSYLWSTGATTEDLTALTAGTYTVTVTDDFSCTVVNSYTITEPATLMAAGAVDSNVSCNSFSDGGATASAAGGTMPYTYTWSNSATNASITGVVAGTYSVTITDANGCTDSASVTITEPATLVAATVVDSNVSCNGFSDGGATASATGGTMPYTYAWSNSATTASITSVVAGTYTVTITDNNGCTATSSTAVTEPATLMAATVVDSNVSCNGFSDGGATASATGGTMPYTYAWSNSATTASITSVVAGTYTVTITDNNGCTATSSTTVTEPAMLMAATVVDSNASCNGFSDGGATASATGGTMPYTYAWSNSATTASITSVVAGTYTVTITDNNGCTATSSTAVTEPAVLMISGTPTPASCTGGSDGMITTTPSGGTMAYTYLWSNGSTTKDLTNISAGTYTVTITDANGCTTTNSQTVNEPAGLTGGSVGKK